MTVMMERERWNDERLDERFDRVDGEIRELRVEMRAGFERIDRRFDQIGKRFDQIDKRFEKVDGKFDSLQRETTARFEAMQAEMNLRFDALQRNTTTWAIALFSAIVTLNAAVIATISLA